MAQTAAKNNLWWPFTQHATVLQDNVTVIDSRNGESFAIYKTGNEQGSGAKLQMQYDACASWWTQVQLLHVQRHACKSCTCSLRHVRHVPCSLHNSLNVLCRLCNILHVPCCFCNSVRVSAQHHAHVCMHVLCGPHNIIPMSGSRTNCFPFSHVDCKSSSTFCVI